MFLRSFTLSSAFLLLVSGAAMAHPEDRAYDPNAKVADTKPAELQGVGISEKLGQNLDPSLKFKDENGADVTLGSYFDGKTPVLLSPVYFACPGLCNFHLNGLTEALKGMDWSAGGKYIVLAVSFDPSETPTIAAGKKASYMKVYDRPGTENGWHFLTGTAENVKKLTDSVGFTYHWDEKEKQWAHASAAIAVSPTGTITRYLPGIMFESRDVRMALLEAGEGKIGTFVDQLVLYCFHYNPTQSRYAVYAFNIMKLGGALMVLILAIWLLPTWVRARRAAHGTRGVR